MVSLLALWLPIVVAAVLVFLVSLVLHMALKYHRADYKLREGAILDAMRGEDLVLSYYFFPGLRHEDVGPGCSAEARAGGHADGASQRAANMAPSRTLVRLRGSGEYLRRLHRRPQHRGRPVLTVSTSPAP
jgi:hypothetical protein